MTTTHQQETRDDWTAAYHLYGAAHDLLYVGKTKDFDQRLRDHRTRRAEWHLVRRYEVAWFRTEALAADVERTEIARHSPPWNQAGTDRVRGSRAHVRTYHHAVDAIAAQVASGQLVPGQRLPPMRVLRAQLGVSKHSLDTAMMLLKRQRLIRGHQGRGTFVVDPLPPTG